MLKRMLELKKILSVMFLKTEKIFKTKKINVKCDLKNDLKFLKKSKRKIVVGQININSIRNKLDPVMAAVAGFIEILFITETKIQSTFCKSQFYLNDQNFPYKNDRHTNGGSILVYVRDDRIKFNVKVYPVNLKVWL